MHSSIVVLGGGPGGYAAAFLAADMGMEVTIVDSESGLGGTCLLRGCIPSKALLHVAKVIDESRELTENWGVSFEAPKIDVDKVRARKESVIQSLSSGLGQLAKRRDVNVIHARGTFTDSNTLTLEGDDPSIADSGQITFDHCIIATGSSPFVPPALLLESDRVMDSTGALALADVPQKMLVIGGGYIGLEMATVYASLGSKVDVVELTNGLLPLADRDLVKPLARKLDKILNEVMLDTKVGNMTEIDDHIQVTFEGPARLGVEDYDRVLVVTGRRPNSADLGLESTKVAVNEKGFVQCDKSQRTADPAIFAIGDVAGEPMLAHKASHEAKVAVAVLAGHDMVFDHKAIPAVVFTDPEIAWAGLTETEAKSQDIKVEVMRYPWAASGRAQAIGATDGLTKLLIDPESERVLGCGIVGVGAGELIAEAVLAIEMGCEARDITKAIHPHPTLSETVMNAGELFFGSAVEIYKPKRS